MTIKKDKQKVLGERFTTERIAGFLDLTAPAGVNIDYHRLERAYRSMVADDFAIFVSLFKERGGDIEATSPRGETIAQLIGEHQSMGDYLKAL